MAHTTTWNTAFEGTPADGVDARGGGARIRELKQSIQERMELDHKWDPAAPDDTNDGFHNTATLLDQGGNPSAKTDAFRLYSKDDTDNELFGIDEGGTVIQFTQGGKHWLIGQQNNWGAGQYTGSESLADGSTVTINCALSNSFYWTIGGNRTLANPTNPGDGQVVTVLIKQDATGGRTITYGSKWKFPNGIDSNPASGASEFSMISAMYIAGFDIWAAGISKDLS